MPKREDLQGQKFNHLTVIALDVEKTNQTRRSHWICECDCDNHTRFSVAATNLKRGNTTKCKYCKSENLIGKTYNKLTVIERFIDTDDHVKWKCKCECGNIIIVRADSLKSGHTKSCGCLQKAHAAQLNAHDLVGQRFGKLVVKSRSNKKDANGQYYWFCDCDCGTKNKEISGHNLVSRGTESCGCIRSKGEEKIVELLTQYNIPFIREYSPNDFRFQDTNNRTFFDFAILDTQQNIQYFIEYQGEQHYQSRGSIFTPEKVEQIQSRDKQKVEYCTQKNIPLLQISYKDYPNLTINHLLLKKGTNNDQG